MEDITFEGKLLSEYVKDQEELELQQKIKSHNIDNSKSNYQKPRLRFNSKKERNGKVMALQNEVNFRNKDNLIAEALTNGFLKDAMVYWMIGGYKHEKLTTKMMADDFEKIIKDNSIKTKFKNIFAACRNYLGKLKKTVLFKRYGRHVKEFPGGNYFYLIADGYKLAPQKAIKLSYQKEEESISENKKEITTQLKEINLAENNEIVEIETTEENAKSNLANEIINKFGIDWPNNSNLTVNILGPINIYLKE